MDAALRALVRISTNLSQINKNLEKFLKPPPTVTKVSTPTVTTADVEHLVDRIHSDDVLHCNVCGASEAEAKDCADCRPSTSMLFCSWCMGEIDLHIGDVCQHATLCSACAPCDECQPKENQ